MDAATIIERSIVIAADRERVWQAITGPGQFMKWFGNPATDLLDFKQLAAGEELIFHHGGGIWYGDLPD